MRGFARISRSAHGECLFGWPHSFVSGEYKKRQVNGIEYNFSSKSSSEGVRCQARRLRTAATLLSAAVESLRSGDALPLSDALRRLNTDPPNAFKSVTFSFQTSFLYYLSFTVNLMVKIHIVEPLCDFCSLIVKFHFFWPLNLLFSKVQEFLRNDETII